MFHQIKKQLQDRFAKMATSTTLYYAAIDREEVFKRYIEGFSDPVERQGHTCNACRSFLRQYAGIVVIDANNVKHTLWDFARELPDNLYELYAGPINALRNYVSELPVTDVFYSDTTNAGTQKNRDLKRGVEWEHFSLVLPRNVVQRVDNIPTMQSTYRSTRDVFKRALEEITMDSINTVIDLIKQGSLYRGNEHLAAVERFKAFKQQYTRIPRDLQDNFLWREILSTHGSVSGIRSTVIGTLLVDLSEGVDMDDAVTKYEAKVAPANYKRPTALVTPRMVDDAKKKLEELGLMSALERRYATEADLNVNDILFTDKSSSLTDVFAEMKKDTPVSVRSLSKVEEVSISKFISDVLPTAKAISVLFENSHLNNMVSLLTSKDKEAPNLFKWNNPFSWSYTGGIADAMKERVKAAGGNVTGVLRFSIQWNEDGNSICDFDAHAWEPKGQEIAFNSNRHPSSTNATGQLDVDMIRPTKVGIENITWKDLNKMHEGNYRFAVYNYDGGRNNGFRAQIEFDGQIYEFATNKHTSGWTEVAVVTFSRKDGFSIVSRMGELNSTISDKEKWNLKTNRFIKVKKFMLSPNYWDARVSTEEFLKMPANTGNKHYMFFLENAQSDEDARPFYNEFLRADMDKHRKFFEILAGKLKVEPPVNQLSGLGFSETVRNHLYVQVDGAFKRTLKINF